ncbi:MAG: NRDE family protein [Desulfobacterales bacterium]|nr:MAG: NRDE family protein [Desulfobacterales bacterium]
MCLILFSYQMHPLYPLVFAANRDEFYNRPTAPLDFQDEARQILSGRDIKHNGTWLGVTKTGRLAAITNFRDPSIVVENAPSRGHLISDFLTSDESPETYLETVKSMGNQYNGFNIIAGNPTGLFYYSNRGKRIQKIRPGLHGLSNKFLNTPWPKIEKGKAYLKEVIDGNERINPEDIFNILKDNAYPPSHMLPNTGVGRCWEKILSPLFITSKFYGTRSSSIILMEKTGKVIFMERTFIIDSAGPQEENTREFSFIVSP